MPSFVRRFALLPLLLWPCSMAVLAQRPLIERHAPGTSEYIIGPGDQVSIHVEDLDDISDRPIRIDPNGFIDLPLIGRTEAGGLTIEQLRQELEKKLTKYVTSPQITINLIENNARFVSVIGSVNNPGVHPLEGPQHLIDAISMSGGVRADAGSHIVIIRQAHWGELPLAVAKTDPTGVYSTATVPLHDLVSGQDPSLNILLDPGDVISVAKAEIVYVLGTVKRAGGFPLEGKDSISLLQTLSLAQGLDHDAAANKARILRPAPTGDGHIRDISVDIPKILNGKNPDVLLYANDVLYIPGSAAKSMTKRSVEAVLTVATGLAIYR
jgi:polysaccharide biosynthesis/export protein